MGGRLWLKVATPTPATDREYYYHDYVEHIQFTDLIHRICEQQKCSRFPVIAMRLTLCILTERQNRAILKKKKKKKKPTVNMEQGRVTVS